MSEDWNRLIPSQEELERAEEERKKRDAQWDRWERRVGRWAASRDKREVTELLTAVSMMLYWERKDRRDWTQSAMQWAESNSAAQYRARASMDAARNLAGKLKKTSDDRKRGPAARYEKNGYPVKRQAVERAWDAYNKRGRGAKTQFITIQAAEHNVSPRTIEKWVNGK